MNEQLVSCIQRKMVGFIPKPLFLCCFFLSVTKEIGHTTWGYFQIPNNKYTHGGRDVPRM